MGNNQDFLRPKKRDLLFLHGYLSSGKSFNFQTEFFKNYYNVYAPDLTGFGENAYMAYPYSLTDYAREVKAYIKNNDLKEADVIAHSFGGRIAIKLCAENPNLFRRVVLTGSAGLRPKQTIKKCVKKTTFNILKRFVAKEKLTSFYSKDYNALSRVMKESFKLIISEHLDSEICKIQNPTLIINGEKDKETPKYMAKRLHKGIKGSRLIFMQNAGHFCFIDSPMKFNVEVREFLLS